MLIQSALVMEADWGCQKHFLWNHDVGFNSVQKKVTYSSIGVPTNWRSLSLFFDLLFGQKPVMTLKRLDSGSSKQFSFRSPWHYRPLPWPLARLAPCGLRRVSTFGTVRPVHGPCRRGEDGVRWGPGQTEVKKMIGLYMFIHWMTGWYTVDDITFDIEICTQMCVSYIYSQGHRTLNCPSGCVLQDDPRCLCSRGQALFLRRWFLAWQQVISGAKVSATPKTSKFPCEYGCCCRWFSNVW